MGELREIKCLICRVEAYWCFNEKIFGWYYECSQCGKFNLTQEAMMYLEDPDIVRLPNSIARILQ